MEKLPIEIIEQIILHTDEKGFKEICKTNSRFESVCYNVARMKLKSMGFKVSDKNLDYIGILQEFDASNIKDPYDEVVEIFARGCKKNKLDFVKFFLLQDLKKVDYRLGYSSSEVLKRCLAISIKENFEDVVLFLKENNVSF